MKETGPIYDVPLIDILPCNPGGKDGIQQAMPSRSDLEGIRNYRQGHRVAAGYEVLLHYHHEAAAELDRLHEPCKLIHCNCGACGEPINEDGYCGCEDNRRHPAADVDKSRLLQANREIARLRDIVAKLRRGVRCIYDDDLSEKRVRHNRDTAISFAQETARKLLAAEAAGGE